MRVRPAPHKEILRGECRRIRNRHPPAGGVTARDQEVTGQIEPRIAQKIQKRKQAFGLVGVRGDVHRMVVREEEVHVEILQDQVALRHVAGDVGVDQMAGLGRGALQGHRLPARVIDLHLDHGRFPDLDQHIIGVRPVKDGALHPVIRNNPILPIGRILPIAASVDDPIARQNRHRKPGQPHPFSQHVCAPLFMPFQLVFCNNGSSIPFHPSERKRDRHFLRKRGAPVFFPCRPGSENNRNNLKRRKVV